MISAAKALWKWAVLVVSLWALVLVLLPIFRLGTEIHWAGGAKAGLQAWRGWFDPAAEVNFFESATEMLVVCGIVATGLRVQHWLTQKIEAKHKERSE